MICAKPRSSGRRGRPGPPRPVARPRRRPDLLLGIMYTVCYMNHIILHNTVVPYSMICCSILYELTLHHTVLYHITVACLPACLPACLICLLACLLACLGGWVVGWLGGWLACLLGLFACWLVGRLLVYLYSGVGWLVGWSFPRLSLISICVIIISSSSSSSSMIIIIVACVCLITCLLARALACLLHGSVSRPAGRSVACLVGPSSQR